MLLYKYCGPEGVAILRERSIWLTDPASYDDPFEPESDVLVLSLSARRDSVPMWRQYAAAHTGLVIGFDAMQGILTGEFPHEYRLAPLVYTSVRPEAATEAHLHPIKHCRSKSHQSAPTALLPDGSNEDSFACRRL